MSEMKEGWPDGKGHEETTAAIDAKLTELAALFEPGAAIVVHVRQPSSPGVGLFMANFTMGPETKDLTDALEEFTGKMVIQKPERMQ